MLPIPHEFAIGGVYLPPMLIAAILGVALATLSGRLLNRNHWSQHFFLPTAGHAGDDGHLYRPYRDFYHWKLKSEAFS
jgi:hypothetical protein